jgi:hypothetical protein
MRVAWHSLLGQRNVRGQVAGDKQYTQNFTEEIRWKNCRCGDRVSAPVSSVELPASAGRESVTLVKRNRVGKRPRCYCGYVSVSRARLRFPHSTLLRNVGNTAINLHGVTSSIKEQSL